MRYYALAERPWVVEDGAGHWGLPDGAIGAVDLAPIGSQSWVFVTSDRPIAGEAVFGDGTRLHQHSLTPAERTTWTGLTGVALPSDVTLLDALWHTLTAAADPDGSTRAKPILPTHRGRLELHLGGHSLIRAEQMPADPTLHPAWPQIQAVLQADYREIHKGAEVKGRAFVQRAGGNPILARKYLGAMADKYRLPPEDASRLLIPHGMAREAPLRPTTEIWDDFDRPDGDLDGSQSAEGWSWTSNGAGISGGQAQFNNNHWARAEQDLSSDDHASSAELWTASGNRYVGPLVRCSPTEKTFYQAGWYEAWASFRAHKCVAGSESSIGNFPSHMEDGDIHTLIADGSTISMLARGETVGSATDTAITGYFRPGLGSARSSASGTAGTLFDNWSAADLLAPPDTPKGGVAGPVVVTAGAAGASTRRGGTIAPLAAQVFAGGRARRAGGADAALAADAAALGRAQRMGGTDALAMLSGEIAGASVRGGGHPAPITVTATAGGQDVSDTPGSGAVAPVAMSAAIGGRSARFGGMDGALVVAALADGRSRRQGGASAAAAVGAAALGRGVRYGGSVSPVALTAAAGGVGIDPDRLPPAQQVVPGVWMRRTAAGTWQRREAPGIWRRAQ